MKKHAFFTLSVQKFLASAPMSWLMAQILHHMDALVLRLSGGKQTLAGITGVPIVQVTTIGAKSGHHRRLPLTGLPDGENYVLIASNFGRAHHPGWYYNLKANPECTVNKGGTVRTYVAREADEIETKHYYDLAVKYNYGYAVYKQRAGKRRIPVMILEPKR
jgi:deazaflavin-dependent oxidoreductase (nitroreductase family)